MVNEEYEPDPTEQDILNVMKEECRANPYLLRDRTGHDKGTINTALTRLTSAGWLRKVTRGLYEFVDDPREQGAGREQESARLSGEREGGVEAALQEVEFPDTKDRGDCVAAVESAYVHLLDAGSATMSEITIAVMPEHPVGYNAEADVAKINDPDQRNRSTWWRKIIKPGLEALPDVESPPKGRSDWSYVGRDDEGAGSSGVYDPAGEF